MEQIRFIVAATIWAKRTDQPKATVELVARVHPRPFPARLTHHEFAPSTVSRPCVARRDQSVRLRTRGLDFQRTLGFAVARKLHCLRSFGKAEHGPFTDE